MTPPSMQWIQAARCQVSETVYVRCASDVLPDDWRVNCFLTKLRGVAWSSGVKLEVRKPARVTKDTMQLLVHSDRGGANPPKRGSWGVVRAGRVTCSPESPWQVRCLALLAAGLLGIEAHHARLAEDVAARPVRLPKRKGGGRWRGNGGPSRSGLYRRDS